ncbi:MAG TPA: hypothetical protein VFC16_00030 [Nakamurella sp.]|nr:hypothetical protein [Nakamurella sp.]
MSQAGPHHSGNVSSPSAVTVISATPPTLGAPVITTAVVARPALAISPRICCSITICWSSSSVASMSSTCGIQLSPATSPTRPANTVVPKEASESRVSASRARKSRMTSAIDGTCTSRSGFSTVSALAPAHQGHGQPVGPAVVGEFQHEVIHQIPAGAAITLQADLPSALEVQQHGLITA